MDDMDWSCRGGGTCPICNPIGMTELTTKGVKNEYTT